jgi:hypothetical protein
MAEKTTRDELDRILNLEGETIEVAGEQLTIKPFRLKQLSAVLRCVESLTEHGVFERSDNDGNKVREFSFPKMLLKGGDSVIEILAIATGKPVEWLGELNPVDGTRLAKAVWGTNADFFTRNQAALRETLGPVWALVEELIPNLGVASSSDSSAPATS